MDKVILHCDLNSFFASVEVKHNAALKGKPVAVCGLEEERHGIVLAKTDPAKRFGVKTGEAIWQAKQKCPNLITVPPNFELYEYYSQKARDIYYRYTDLVEPFGIDECWLDVTGSRMLFGDGYTIAEKIRNKIKNELGLTISVGVSFNKIFAKLASDIKKPDAVTIISKNNFKDTVWHIPVSDMLGIGKATSKKLAKYGIYTIGQLAKSDISLCKKIFGKIGSDIWKNANGLGDNMVHSFNYYEREKSIGRGNTFSRDLKNNEEIKSALIFLSEDVSKRLRDKKLSATKVQISVKNNELISRDFQAALEIPTQCFTELAKKAYKIFSTNYDWNKDVRALTVRAIDLIPNNASYQIPIFCNHDLHDKEYRRECTIDKIRQRYGTRSIETASLYFYRQKSPKVGIQFNTLPQNSIKNQNHVFV